MNLYDYKNFVTEVTSEESKSFDGFTKRITELNDNTNVNIPLLITAYSGLSAESGEFAEIPKKILFQGKPLDEASIFHMKRELGDIMWYWINACNALNLNPESVIKENVSKLESRYPGGFDAFMSENRKKNDI